MRFLVRSVRNLFGQDHRDRGYSKVFSIERDPAYRKFTNEDEDNRTIETVA